MSARVHSEKKAASVLKFIWAQMPKGQASKGLSSPILSHH